MTPLLHRSLPPALARRPGAARTAAPTLALAIALAACAGGPEPAATTGDWTWHTELGDAEIASLPNAPALLHGIDAPDSTAVLRAGDVVLFGLHLLRERETRSWFVRITSLEDEAAIGDELALRVEVFDATGQPIATTNVATSKHLVTGAAHACELANGTAADRTEQHDGTDAGPRTAPSRAAFAVMDVLRIVQETDALANILWQALRRPSLFSLLGGVRVSAGMDFTFAQPTRDPATNGPAFAFPLDLHVNGTQALVCTVTATAPDPPLRVCGGITRLVAHDPLDPHRRVVLRLLAAHRTNGAYAAPPARP